MFSRFIAWIKNNKLTALLVAFVIYKFFNPIDVIQNFTGYSRTYDYSDSI